MRVASEGSPMMRFALGHRGHESPGDVRQVGTELGAIGVYAADEVVLLVSHDPRAGRIAMIPRRGVTEVSGLHGAVVVVAAVNFGVAVVEAAAAIEVLTVNDPVLSLSLIVDRGALGVVLAEAHARRDEDSVGFVAHDRHRGHVSDRKIIEPTHSRPTKSSAGRLDEVIVLWGLVIDD